MLTLVKAGSSQWFADVGKTLLPRVKIPRTWPLGHDRYSVEMIKAIPVCVTHSHPALSSILSQITEWEENHPVESWTWHKYLDSLKSRMDHLQCQDRTKIIDWLYSQDVPCGHFCHGDLTLENVLVDNTLNIWLIDPNPRVGFKSVHLDYGKLLFSLSYHDLFGSYWLSPEMRNWLERISWSVADRACLLTHIIRLQGHRDPARINPWLLREFAQCESL